MTRTRAALAALVLTVLPGALTSGCGIPSSGVMSGGEPATGLTQALRIYYVRDSALQAVSRPGFTITNPEGSLKLLASGPTRDEQERGLTNLVELRSYSVTGSGTRITLHAPGTYFGTGPDHLADGQLICTLARAQAFLHKAEKVRPDDVQVTLANDESSLGPYRCAQFLAR
ncbi:hypothetical protein [Streptomyces sp. cg36]|uniref:hypothetical protein n=1 Tax=Streptomyces sp. cg36 TaxID=3238798 RepID=UPI0034E2CDE0